MNRMRPREAEGCAQGHRAGNGEIRPIVQYLLPLPAKFGSRVWAGRATEETTEQPTGYTILHPQKYISLKI